MRVDVSVVLPYAHAADLPALLAEQQRPSSPWYGHYLTAAQFRNYFSPSPATYSSALTALRHAGFTVVPSANRTLVHAFAPAVVAQAYFSTKIDRVAVSGQPNAYANVRPALIPPQLRGTRVEGLNNLVHVIVPSRGVTAAVRRQTAPAPLFGPDGGFGPLALTRSGDLPVEHGYTGRDSNVADLIDGSASDTDVATFLKYFGITRSGPRTTNFAVDGGCGTACFDDFTAVYDAEWVLGVAPGASYFTYQLPSLSNGAIADGFNRIASDDAVNVVNVSFGSCEVSGGDLLLAIQPLVAQGAAEGITYEAISFGGGNVCSLPISTAPAPADLDTLTAVGGSSTATDASGKELSQTSFSGSGGGVSVVVPIPAWQAGTPGVVKSGRNVPDIVVPNVVDGTGSSVYFGGAWAGGGLYINNAPFAGYLATVQQMYGYGTPMGNVAPRLYAALHRTGYSEPGKSYFRDVTLGCIGAVDNKPVCARTGYDVASGIGSVRGGYALARAFGYGPIRPPR